MHAFGIVFPIWSPDVALCTNIFLFQFKRFSFMELTLYLDIFTELSNWIVGVSLSGEATSSVHIRRKGRYKKGGE